MKNKLVKILKSKSGVTLVELIVGIVLFTIISLSVTMLYAPTLKMYAKVTETAEYGTLSNTISNEIMADLQCATKAATIGSGGKSIEFETSKTTIIFEVSNGVLTKNGGEILDKRYYKNKILELKFVPLTNAATDVYAYEIQVKLSNASQSTFLARNYTVKPLALTANQ